MTFPVSKFTDIVQDKSGGNQKLPQELFLTKGDYPVVDQGKKFIAGYIKDKDYLVKSTDLPVIVFGDHTKAIKFIDFPFAMGADGVKVLKPKAECDTKYLYHYLRYAKIPDAGYSRHYKFLKELEIPLPSLSEQRRIASILDQADELRQKRQQAIEKLDQLLQAIFIDMFGDPASNPKNFETIKFSKIGKWKSGATPSKANENFWIGDFPWVSPKDMKVDHLFDAQDHISDLAFKETNLKKIAKGHLLIVVRGMILAHSFPTAINEVDVSINQDMKAIEPIDQVNIVYLKCAIDAFKPFILELISDAAHGTKRFDLVYAELINIPIPPLSLQLKFQTIYQKIKFERLKYEKQLLECDSLFKSLQNQAFSGTL